uniref:NADH-ubiquinone oxidoreductase chain 5 n=2 Tax=Vespula germanica TaxID=30212 RepID=A0A0U2GUJ4_VESGE|nr:NADH dehydrogenase subunit 5 [Vespula germanica]UZG65638.1 NADH dehydrogenase subunit 5 [Vespula germanica]UZG65649.1 NADH dehydrogenase subunit 5 [Vespula germanica]UZG65662.1 NADH dehydrogenase subunit 5 [Vespula germanica]UZG65675.1 NADH dehydrogenase subunit 5 [Vespula germanica]
MLIMNIFFFFIIGFLMMILSLIFLYLKMSLLMEWVFMFINSMNMEFIIYLDWISLMFLSLVLTISSFVMMYSLKYMEGDKYMDRFFLLLMMFVLSMLFLIVCPNIMGLLLGWDGLGLISYCLVIYYQNIKSFNSGMITVLLNRVGDVGILMMISLLVILGSWNMMFYEVEFFLLSLLMVMSAFTKSAQLPFSVWLPLAMAAPTPVSSLVHSSTLVTAGVYLVMRYNYFLMDNNIMELMLFISSSTMFMSGLMANFEFDLKKIIALSTLSQLGLMMSILSLGKVDLGFMHLVIHALFKSLLFMCSGILIHQMNNNQDIRFMGSLISYYPFVSVVFFISLLSLCGFPFFSGYYSKDLIMEIFLMSKMNLFSLLMLMVATMFTVSYSVRLLIFVFFNYINKSNYFILVSEDFLMSLSMVFLYFYSLMIGHFLISLIDEDLIILNLFEKLLVLQVCLIGVLVGWVLSFMNFINMSNMSKLYLSSMWGLNILYSKISYYPMKFSFMLYSTFDKGILEYLFVYNMKKGFLKSFLSFLSLNYFVYLNLFTLLYVLIMLALTMMSMSMEEVYLEYFESLDLEYLESKLESA